MDVLQYCEERKKNQKRGHSSDSEERQNVRLSEVYTEVQTEGIPAGENAA